MHAALREEGSRARRTKAARDAARPPRHRSPSPAAIADASAAAQAPRLARATARLRVRWERVGRIGLLVVLTVVVVGLYVEHTLSYVATHAQAGRQQAIVTKLTRQNAQLTREEKALNTPSTIVSQAMGARHGAPQRAPPT